MPYPYTPILDAFTGADETPIATNWSTSISTGVATGCRRLSNQIAAPSAGGWGGSYYDLATFGPDTEVYITMPTIPLSGETMSVYARILSPGTSAASAYQAKYVHGAPGFVEAIRMVNGATFTSLGTAASTLAAGDKVGMYVYGNKIEVWTSSAGTWALTLGPITESALPTAGYIGTEMFNTTVRGDDFGGGTLAATRRLDDYSLFPKVKLQPAVPVRY